MAKIRVRARTVDMLGHQQIAGLPTAISELFKNAHDAYAKCVEVDFYRFDDLFILRDDGIGMTLQDFEQRWLTLGTDSKLAAIGGIAPPPRDPDQPERIVLGEKGIGRLAIATIGDQLLVITRARRAGRPGSTIASFLNWRLFALPGIDLDQIEIPIREVAGGTLPERAVVESMIDEVRDNIRRITRSLKQEDILPLFANLDKFKVDPTKCAEFLPSGPSLLEDGCGTHYFIQPADSTLKDDIRDPDDTDRASPLIKALIGFTNTMTPGHITPPIVARFRDHMSDGVCEERIGDSAFFSPDEFESADHHFQGTFDVLGQFQGTVKIYNEAPIEYVSSWPNPTGQPTNCGPFSINVAYVQGASRESRMPPDEHAILKAKLERMGGLYIYRDGMRILPYGDSDYDFLDIERRRTKSAGYYFFSYRRMFGVIEINRALNGALVEKAGREGFRQNRAYRQFREILENFFVQLAADFFRPGGEHAPIWSETKAELDRTERLRRKREQETKAKRAEFATALASFFSVADAQEPEKEVASLIDRTNRRLAVITDGDDQDAASVEALQLEAQVDDQLTALRDRFHLVKPRGWGLNKSLRQDWEAYKTEYLRLENDVFNPAKERLHEMIARTAEEAGLIIDKRVTLKSSIEALQSVKERSLQSIEGQIKAEMPRLQERVVSRSRKCINAVKAVFSEALDGLEAVNLNELSEMEIERQRSRWERRVTDAVQQASAELDVLLDQIRQLGTDAGIESLELAGAMEEEVDDLRERDMAQLELVQVGMALGIIHHEFRGCIKSLRNSLKSLKRWADTNKSLAKLYGDIRANFDHLDGYLTLFTPLTRRLYRTPVEIAGSAIVEFLSDLFGDRLHRHQITLEATPHFTANTVVGYPSSFYPCFANLIDNAIYWLSDQKRVRHILLDADNDGFTIEDTGPGIRSRDAEHVFELGFTRKPGGQGMGLYICKQTLAKIGYELILVPYEKGRGAKFRITPVK